MTLKLALSSKVLQDQPLEEVITIAARCGYTGVELFGLPNHLPVDTPRERVQTLARRCADLGLTVVSLCTYVGGFAEGSDAENERQLEAFRRYLEIAPLLGCDLIRLWPDKLGTRPLRLDHWLRAAHYLARAADEALRAGCRVLLECHLALTATTDRALRLLRLIDRPNVVLTYDPGNMYLAGDRCDRAQVLRLAPYIANVQIKDAARQPTPTHDCLLGEGEIDYRPILQALREIGYQGFYCAEAHKVPRPDLPSAAIAAHEYQALRALLEASLAPAGGGGR